MVVAVFIGCLMPNPPQIEPSIPQFDKLEHFTAYLVMAAWFAAPTVAPRRWFWIAVALVGMGGAIEILQGMSGYRDAEWLDWVADGAGVAAAFVYPVRWTARLYAKWVVSHVPVA